MPYEASDIMASSFPSNLEEFVGQENAVEILLVAIGAAQQQATALPHTLIYGPAGLGKTTIATCTAKTLNIPIYYAVGSKIKGIADVNEVVEFISMRVNPMVFIDEVHAMPKKIEELFFPLMQDFSYNGERVNTFTMMGATTNAGDVIKPMRDRFKYVLRLNHYSVEAITTILLHNEPIESDAAVMLANRSFGIPRIAKNYLTHCHDQAIFSHPEDFTIRVDDVKIAMNRLGVDDEGIDPTQRSILLYLYNCGCPVGLETIAMVLDIELSNLKELHERVLLYREYIIRTRAGRKITRMGKDYLRRNELVSD